MEQNPCCEANGYSASHKTSHLKWNAKFIIMFTQPATGPSAELDASSPHSPTLPKIHSVVIFPSAPRSST